MGLKKIAKRAVWALLVSLLVTCVFPYQIPRLSASPIPSTFEGFRAKVIGDVCNIRSGPDTDYRAIGTVTMGAIVEIISFKDNWAKITYKDKTGYIAGWLIDIDLASKGVSARITATDVNVREGPGTGFRVKSMTDKGKVFPAEAKRGEWIRVTLNTSGSTGWISESLLKLEYADAAPPPPVDPPRPPLTGNLVVYPARDTLTVSVNAVNGSDVVATLAKGESARVIGAEGAWLMVETSNGLKGWVYGPNARITSPSDPSIRFIVSETAWTIGKYPTSTVTATDVNFRGGPGTSYPIIGSLDRGDSLWVLSTQGDWMQVVSPKGITGWVAGWLTSGPTPPPEPAFTVSAKATGADRLLTVTGPFQSSVVVPGTDGGSVIVSTSEFFNTSVELPVYSFEFGTIRVAGSDVTVSFQGKANYNTVTSAPGKVELEFTPTVTALDVRSTQVGDVLTIETVGYAWADVRREGDVVTLFLPGATLADEIPPVRGTSVKDVTVSERDGGLDVAVRTAGQLPYLITRTANSIQATFGVSGLSGKRIVVDPGHEASDPGAIGPTGLAERNVNWEIATRLAGLLEQSGASVVITRTSLWATSEGPPGWVMDPSTYSCSLSERAAWSQGADLFISIHNDFNYDRSVGGTTVYVCDKNPNASESRRFASMALSELTRAIGTRDRGVKNSNLYVVREAKSPAVLVEVMFISNPVEESYLRQAQTWDKAAQGLFKAVQRYFGPSNVIPTPGT